MGRFDLLGSLMCGFWVFRSRQHLAIFCPEGRRSTTSLLGSLQKDLCILPSKPRQPQHLLAVTYFSATGRLLKLSCFLGQDRCIQSMHMIC